MTDVTLQVTGERNSDGNDAVHVAYLAKAPDGQIWTLMMVRLDGSLGFPGGKVDPGETLEGALVRENMEEINWRLVMDGVQMASTHQIERNGYRTHLYIKQVDFGILRTMANMASGATHFQREMAGCFILPVNNVIEQYREVPKADTVSEQLVILGDIVKGTM